jgi:ribosomal-protein-alanine N-acetyltransferase
MTQRPHAWRLELLTMDHATELERFERDNRAFFASRIGDRGDDYFAHFDERLAALVEENRSGRSLLSLVVDEAGHVLARINLTDIDEPDLSELGYRVAESAQGQGVATYGVTALLDLAASRDVPSVFAKVATTNPASQRVLEHCGFALVGPADAPLGSVKSFLGYCRAL